MLCKKTIVQLNNKVPDKTNMRQKGDILLFL